MGHTAKIRFYGTYPNRARIAVSPAVASSTGSRAETHPPAGQFGFLQGYPEHLARLIRKIFETNPLLCTCGARMRIVSLITDHRVVDRILRHRESGRCKAQDPLEPRAPPRPAASFPQ